MKTFRQAVKISSASEKWEENKSDESQGVDIDTNNFREHPSWDLNSFDYNTWKNLRLFLRTAECSAETRVGGGYEILIEEVTSFLFYDSIVSICRLPSVRLVGSCVFHMNFLSHEWNKKNKVKDRKGSNLQISSSSDFSFYRLDKMMQKENCRNDLNVK